MGFGGKGANQAVMAARLGAEVLMVTKLGNDIFGQDTLKNYQTLGFNTDQVLFTDEASTGIAPIWVDEGSSDNAILVIGGANELLSPDDIEAAQEAIMSCQIVMCQWGCPLETSLAALHIGRSAGLMTIFNPSPTQAELPDEAYQLSDIICPNETETELLTGQPVETLEQAEATARILLARGDKTAILTLGERGSLLVDADRAEHISVPVVKAVDTTGAGDAFCGSLSFFLGSGLALPEAVRRANHVAAVSVQRHGTQTIFPSQDELPAELFTGESLNSVDS